MPERSVSEAEQQRAPRGALIKQKVSAKPETPYPSNSLHPMHEPDPINIPAYQRKRSIAAKARKKPAYLETALDRAIKVNRAQSAQKSKKRKTHIRASKASSRTSTPDYRTQTVEHYLQSPNSFDEISIQTTSVLPSQELFPDPFHDSTPARKLEFREMKTCGICEGYYEKIEVAIVRVTSPLRVGDSIIFEKQEGLFEQEIKSMQIDRKDITLATTGSEIGLKVLQKPTVGSQVYKVIE